MGQIYQATCGNCDYSSEMLYLYGGMQDHLTNCSFPFFCESCSELFIGNAMLEEVNCPSCKDSSRVIRYDDPKMTEHPSDPDDPAISKTENRCPKCGLFRMGFASAGCWD